MIKWSFLERLFIMVANVDGIINTLKLYDQMYASGTPLVSDEEYDELYKSTKEENPDHPYFKAVGAAERGGKIDLPFPMGSLDQVYDQNDIQNWVKRFNLLDNQMIISHKLDGVSCMIHYKYGKLQQAFSRGNGIQGADVTRHISKMSSIPQTIPFYESLYIRCEVIMKNSTFQEKYSNDFKNPRNLVAGCMNRKVTEQSMLDDIDVIAYDIVSIDSKEYEVTKLVMFDLFKEWNIPAVKYQTLKGKELTSDSLSTTLSEFRTSSVYELDGIVITNDDYLNTGDRKSQSLNPTHSVKFKVLDEDSIVVSKVVDVLWEISKSGYLKPRIEIEPVELFGTTVRYATGFNAKFINDNKIGEDTLVKITKSGSVIPYIVDVVHSTEAKLPDMEWEWNENGVEIVVDQNNETVLFKQCLDYFVSLDVELLKEASLKKMFDAHKLWGMSFVDTCDYLFDLISLEWIQVIGSNGQKIYDSLHRRLQNLTMDKALGSLPFMGFGFGVRKAKQLLNQVSSDDLLSLTEDDIIALDGFDEITANKLINSLPMAFDFFDKFSDIINIIEENVSDELKNVVLVMSGFRDKELKAQIESMGGRVTTSVSSKTTHLLTPDVNGSSSKIKKARTLDIEIMTPNIFKDIYNI